MSADTTTIFTAIFSQPRIAAAFVAGIGVLIAAILSITGVIITNLITRRIRERELFVKSVEFLTGGTQTRSVGIAMLERYAKENKKNVKAVVTICVAQARHLIDKDNNIGVKKGDVSDMTRSIEKFNFSRLQAILGDLEPNCDDKNLKTEIDKIVKYESSS